MVKLKKKLSQEFLIVNVIPMDKRPSLGQFVCKNDLTDDTFTVVAEGTHVKKAEYLKNRKELVGQYLTVEFYERSVNKLPFHAVGITVRPKHDL